MANNRIKWGHARCGEKGKSIKQSELPNALTTHFVGLLSHYIMMIIFIAASRDIFLMSPPSAQMAYNGAEETETAPKRVSV